MINITKIEELGDQAGGLLKMVHLTKITFRWLRGWCSDNPLWFFQPPTACAQGPAPVRVETRKQNTNALKGPEVPVVKKLLE